MEALAMTSITRRFFLSLAAALAPGSVVAHHGWGGYDTSKSFTVTGKILKSTFENPHCEIEMEVDGKRWHFVLAPPSRMQARGATADLIAVGKTLHRVRLSSHQQAGRGAASSTSFSMASASNCGRSAWSIRRTHRYS
jgi:hypothetical protein